MNAEKSPMDRGELERRLEQFSVHQRVAVTRSPLFVDKARLFPGCTFLVGYDTAARLIDTKFYDGSVRRRDEAIAAILSCGCRVLVAGRMDGGAFKTLDDLSIPAGAERLFVKLPDFRADVSGAALRQAAKTI
jgi:hypothetical protein